MVECQGCGTAHSETGLKQGLCDDCLEPIAKNSSYGLGVASVIIGILSFFFLTIILAPIGLYLGYRSYKQENNMWSVAGLAISGTATTIAILFLLFGLAATGLLLAQ